MTNDLDGMAKDLLGLFVVYFAVDLGQTLEKEGRPNVSPEDVNRC